MLQSNVHYYKKTSRKKKQNKTKFNITQKLKLLDDFFFSSLSEANFWRLPYTLINFSIRSDYNLLLQLLVVDPSSSVFVYLVKIFRHRMLVISLLLYCFQVDNFYLYAYLCVLDHASTLHGI